MTVKLPKDPLACLSADHRRQLIEGSAIAPESVAERGYYTATQRSEVPDGFKDYQRRPGLLIPTLSPSGATGLRLRPDRPRKGKNGQPRKYEQPAGASNTLDVHPRNVAALRNPDTDLWVTEGEKKADCLTSRGLCAVALFGVWGWCVAGTKGQELLPCWDHIALKGRRVFVVFDADVTVKENVQLALERFVAALEERGAVVLVVYLPGPEKGVDDHLVAGGTVNELKMLARKFEPADIGRIRMSRDNELRAAVWHLWQHWRDNDWMHFIGMADEGNWARGHSARDVKEALIELATRGGEMDGNGVVVEPGLRRLSEMSAKSVPSVRKALAHLEADGQIEILPPKDEVKSRRYRLLVPRADLSHYGERDGTEGEDFSSNALCDPTVQPLRAPSAPRLRWSSPGRSRRREFELVPGRCVVRSTGASPAPEDREAKPYVKRLGSHRGAVLDALEAAGGELHLLDLCEALHRDRARVRDLRKRILKPLEEAGIIRCEEDVVRLVRDWLDRLEEERERAEEIEQGERQVDRHREESRRYREHLERRRRGAPTASHEAVRRTEELRERRLREIRDEEERDRAPTPPTVEALVAKVLGQQNRVRMGLLCGVAMDEGLRWRDVPPAVRRMGYRVERLPEYDNAEFVFARKVVA